MSYSQNDEEQRIIELFASLLDKPYAKRFLDIGAHDGVKFSNTRRLAELGWGGTLVEPSAVPFASLMKTYRAREDVNLANLAIVPERSRILAFSDAGGDFVSTFDEAHRALWAAPGADGRPGVQFQKIYVAGVTVAQLLEALPGPYGFVNLDVEGINAEIFRELPLRALGTELVCVEYQDRLRDIEAFANAQGYRRVHITSENVLLAHS